MRQNRLAITLTRLKPRARDSSSNSDKVLRRTPVRALEMRIAVSPSAEASMEPSGENAKDIRQQQSNGACRTAKRFSVGNSHTCSSKLVASARRWLSEEIVRARTRLTKAALGNFTIIVIRQR
jgi:hypothetical protein